MLVNHSCVAKPNLWLGQQHKVVGNLHLGQDLKVFVVIQVNLFALHVAPAVRTNLVAMHVAEDVSFIAAAIYIELVEVAHKAMVCARLRCILRIQIDPLLLDCLKLSQVVKVDPTFPRIAAEEEYTVLKGEAVGA